VKDAVKQWLNGLAAEVYDEGIQKLVIGYGKCRNDSGDYIGKYRGESLALGPKLLFMYTVEQRGFLVRK